MTTPAVVLEALIFPTTWGAGTIGSHKDSDSSREEQMYHFYAVHILSMLFIDILYMLLILSKSARGPFIFVDLTHTYLIHAAVLDNGNCFHPKYYKSHKIVLKNDILILKHTKISLNPILGK